MEAFVGFASLAAGIALWWLLTKSMKINGTPWWWRHLTAAFWAPFAMGGIALLLNGLLGLPGSEGDPSGVAEFVGGLCMLALLALPLGISWRAAKRRLAEPPTPTQTATPLEPFAPSHQPEQPEPSPKPANKLTSPSKALRFTYEDSSGFISQREVTNWKEEGDYIKGFCLDRRDTRTFRKDRIIAFSEGEHLLKGVTAPSYSRPRPTTSKPIVSSKPMEILFTGFPKEKRASLEAQAADEGMLVRTRVTKALDFLCVGPKAAPSKQVEAEHRGATVLDEMAFYDLVESGELPDH